MERVDRLVDKLDIKQQEMLKIIKKMQEENSRLKLELDFLQKDRKNSIKTAKSYENLKRNVENSVLKVERLIKKIDSAKG
jgi:hypothetical protein